MDKRPLGIKSTQRGSVRFAAGNTPFTISSVNPAMCDVLITGWTVNEEGGGSSYNFSMPRFVSLTETTLTINNYHELGSMGYSWQIVEYN